MELIKTYALWIIKNFDLKYNLQLEAVSRDGWALRYIKNQTVKICLVAIKQDGRALRYVENKTKEICLAAAKQIKERRDYNDEN